MTSAIAPNRVAPKSPSPCPRSSSPYTVQINPSPDPLQISARRRLVPYHKRQSSRTITLTPPYTKSSSSEMKRDAGNAKVKGDMMEKLNGAKAGKTKVGKAGSKGKIGRRGSEGKANGPGSGHGEDENMNKIDNTGPPPLVKKNPNALAPTNSTDVLSLSLASLDKSSRAPAPDLSSVDLGSRRGSGRATTYGKKGKKDKVSKAKDVKGKGQNRIEVDESEIEQDEQKTEDREEDQVENGNEHETDQDSEAAQDEATEARSEVDDAIDEEEIEEDDIADTSEPEPEPESDAFEPEEDGGEPTPSPPSGEKRRTERSKRKTTDEIVNDKQEEEQEEHVDTPKPAKRAKKTPLDAKLGSAAQVKAEIKVKKPKEVLKTRKSIPGRAGDEVELEHGSGGGVMDKWANLTVGSALGHLGGLAKVFGGLDGGEAPNDVIGGDKAWLGKNKPKMNGNHNKDTPNNPLATAHPPLNHSYGIPNITLIPLHLAMILKTLELAQRKGLDWYEMAQDLEEEGLKGSVEGGARAVSVSATLEGRLEFGTGEAVEGGNEEGDTVGRKRKRKDEVLTTVSNKAQGKASGSGKKANAVSQKDKFLNGSELYELYHNHLLPALKQGRPVWLAQKADTAADDYNDSI